MTKTNLVIPDYSSYSVAKEIADLKKFLTENNLYVSEKFFTGLRPGDVIDLYANPPDLKQLYCNSEFKRITSYSEDQLKTVPFPKLFWRSEEVQLQLLQRTMQVALKEEEAQPWGVDNHELIESLHPKKRTFEIDLGWIAPCFDLVTKQRVAFASSLRVHLVFEWPEIKQG